VVLSSVTVDTRTVNLVLGTFRIVAAEVTAGVSTVHVESLADGSIDAATFTADTGFITVRTGTAQAGAATTITLDAGASAVDDFYNGDLIVLTGGAGAGQSEFVDSYVGATNVATMRGSWVVNPDNTTTWIIQPFGSLGAGGGGGLDAAGVRAAVGLASANLDTQLGAIDDFLDTEITDIRNRLPAALVSGRIDASVGAMSANTLTASALATDAVTEITSAVLTTQMTESYAANGTAPTLAQAIFAMHQDMMDFSISGTAKTVQQLGGTTAFVVTLNSATTPTAAARA
jgi:hypothetical protein